MEKHNKIYKVCQKPFEAKRSNTKFCSKGCKDFAKGMKIDTSN